jgi:hypothetical protein
MKLVLRLLLCLSLLVPSRAESETAKWIKRMEKTVAEMEEMATDEGTIEVLSIYPSNNSVPPNVEALSRFHNYPILGRAKVADATEKKELLTALAKSIRASIPEDGEGVGSFACFSPRHGIIYTKGEKKLELLICFECEKVYSYDGEQERPVAGFPVKSEIGPDVFNAFLDKHKVGRNAPKK